MVRGSEFGTNQGLNLLHQISKECFLFIFDVVIHTKNVINIEKKYLKITI